MPSYTYVALDPSGKKVKGEIEAKDERTVWKSWEEKSSPRFPFLPPG